MYLGFDPLLQPYPHHLPSDFGPTARALKQRGVPRHKQPAVGEANGHSLRFVMQEGVCGALAADDAFSELGEEPGFRVRETPDWKMRASDLEAEMLRRGETLEVIERTKRLRVPVPDG